MAIVEFRGIREPAIAGTWYPGSPAVLRRTVMDFLANAPKANLPGEIIGLIVPHAGYIYSGQVAAHAYRQIEGLSFDRVVILSPIHRAYMARASAVITAVTTYRTPLGDVPVDTDFIAELSDDLPIAFLRDDDEHSLEIQLPFLQVALSSFELVPIMLADQSLAFCEALGEALAGLVRASKKSTLFVASTDLSHFYRYEVAKSLDSMFTHYVEAYDIVGLASALSQGKAEACGAGPVLATMLACRQLGAKSARILHYANSGDVTGDRSRVVGYAAGAILR